MVIEITALDNSYVINGVQVEKGRLSIEVAEGYISVNNMGGTLSEVSINGNTYSTDSEFIEAADSLLFNVGGGSGGGAVNSVTGTLVGGTSSNPVIDNPLLETHQVIITDGGTRNITDFNGTLFLVTNGIDPATTATLNWNGLDDNTRKLTIVWTFDCPTVLNTSGSGVAVRRLPTSAVDGDVWEVVYDKFYNTWDLVSVNTSGSNGGDVPIGTNRQVLGFNDGAYEAMPINVEHLTDIGGYPSFANGVLTATAMNSTTKTGILSFIEFSTSTPKVGTFATYGTSGVLAVGSGVANGDAVNVGQLNSVSTIVLTPASGSTTVITSGFKGKLIISFTPSSIDNDNPINIDFGSASLSQHAGLEITVINKSTGANVVLRSFSGQTQIMPDSGSSPVSSVTIPPSTGQYFICDGVNLIGT